MRILLVQDYAFRAGGAEIQMLGLRDALRKRGLECRLLASGARVAPGEPEADYLCPGTTSSARGLLQAANPWAARRLRSVLEEFRPHVVHVSMHLTQLSPLILRALRDVPALYDAQWYRAVCPTGTKHLPSGEACTEHWGRACLRNGCLPVRDWIPLMLQLKAWHSWSGAFDLFVANSHATARMLEEHGVGPVEVVWNGVEEREPVSMDPVPTVAFAGRLVAEKGADVLLRAFGRVREEVPGARLKIAGRGPEKERLEELAAELGLAGDVEFLGFVEPDRLDGALGGAWVQVVPSVWAEPFGIVAVEAMMRGRPVVASDVGGLAEIVSPGRTGRLVPPGDVAALASALIRLLTHRRRAEQMGRAGRGRAVASFGRERFVERFVEIYRSLADAGGQPARVRSPATASGRSP